MSDDDSSEGSAKRPRIPSNRELKKLLDASAARALARGEVWYVVTVPFLNELKRALRSPDKYMLPTLDLSSIYNYFDNMTAGYSLKNDIILGIHYTYIYEHAFVRIREACGVANERRDIIKRTVQPDDDDEEILKLELYHRRKFLMVAPAYNIDFQSRIPFSGAESIDDVISRGCTALNTTRRNIVRITVYNDYKKRDLRGPLDLCDVFIRAEPILSSRLLLVYEITDVPQIPTDETAVFPSCSRYGDNSPIIEYSLPAYFQIRQWLPWSLMAVHAVLLRWSGTAAGLSLFWRLAQSAAVQRLLRILKIAFGGLFDPHRHEEVLSPDSCQRGVCALQNLGNSCYMASGLQCLSSVYILTRYFRGGHFRNEINPKAPEFSTRCIVVLIGALTDGKLSASYAKLIRVMWSGHHDVVAPVHFKKVFCALYPRFCGHAQHDAQEFMTTLLDGLHEELKRNKGKPVPQKEISAAGKTDVELGKLSWDSYKQANNSIIVDNFHGMVRSKIVCSNCQTTSVKFDPFAFLSVPLPQPMKRFSQTFVMMHWPVRRWAKFQMTITNVTTVADADKVIQKSLHNSAHADIHSINYDIEAKENEAPDDRCVFWRVGPAENVTILNEDEVLLANGRSAAAPIYCTPKLPSNPHLVVVQNVYEKTDKWLTLPMIFQLEQPNVTHDFVKNEVIPFVIGSFFKENVTRCENYVAYAKLNNSYYEITPQFSLPSACIVIQWASRDSFTKYQGEDLIDRECSVYIPKTVCLRDCIELFTQEEELEGWSCPKCAMQDKSLKALTLWKLPNYLFLHLKRFYFTDNGKEKIEINVKYPVTGLSLSGYTSDSEEDALFDLVAVVNHVGSLLSGHYTATTMNCEHEFNDETIYPITNMGPAISSPSPYMMLYKKRTH